MKLDYIVYVKLGEEIMHSNKTSTHCWLKTSGIQ